MQTMIIFLFLVGLGFLFLGLHRFNIKVIENFLNNKDADLLREDELIELNKEYVKFATNRLAAEKMAWHLTFFEVILFIVVLICVFMGF